MNDVMVSVYCLCYNHEKYIKDALESFVHQKTNFNYEVIVHDDASTDKTADIIKEYAEMYPNIIKPIYQTENQYSKGVRIVQEIILPRIQGKYIALCEGDDYWIDNNKLQMQFDIMEEHPECSLVVHWSKTLKMETGMLMDTACYDKSPKELYALTVDKIIREHTIFTTNSMFFKKDYYDKNEHILNKVKVYDYVHKTLLATEGTVYVIPRCMSVYRFGSDSSWTVSVRNNPQKLITHLEEAISYLNLLNEYRNYKYDNEIKENIKKREFMILIQKGDFRSIRKTEIYKSLSFSKKIITIIKTVFPKQYKIIKYVILPKIQIKLMR